jgi:hypothetical protein
MKKSILILVILLTSTSSFGQKSKGYCSISLCKEVVETENEITTTTLITIPGKMLGDRSGMLFYVELQHFAINKTHNVEFILEDPLGEKIITQKDTFVLKNTTMIVFFKHHTLNPFVRKGIWKAKVKVNNRLVAEKNILCLGFDEK